ncbi:PTS sugar transporter subunit IIB [Enterococcus phoeniculicola]|jgi:PTS system cellobiose-specific IIB component|uniref:PTS EIIB type-3 domain-containing protein n=1 Tax=Enterococcus phoeniculicola ATCC BAA-412 TaxID=1158610 RepID=R3W1Q3_9ENTE|nr:hypothetical protein [Enterococcus phoeniculicola]EOL41577.1 hypothetical protein UC3_03140 [Enterococcus phoeniculicola ATCC BAA-412]EOT78929.1 hypothetical protein I589_00436 [Enterococcus phoeniculicola ATCC BAA-412]
MLIYICCAGGMTSSMFCQKISKAANPNEVYFGSLHDIIVDFSNLSQTYSTLVAYGGEGIIRQENLETLFKPYVDLVYVCPQVRYRTPALKKLLIPLNIPCLDLDMKTFGNMNGKKALHDILSFQIMDDAK